MSKPQGIRGLAKELKLSVSTVSEALRHSPKVRPATRDRVLAGATRAGYVSNPVLSAAMSAARQRAGQPFVGNLALVDVNDREDGRLHPYKAEVVAGARARAEALGFSTDFYWALEAQGGLSLRRLQGVLEARGTLGVVVLSLHIARDFSDFDFGRFAAVQMDLPLLQPRLHTIMPDHTGSMMDLLQRMTLLGYRRVGLVMERYRDRRIGNRWMAGFRGFFSGYDPLANPPPLLVPGLVEEGFRAWFRTHRPDVVLAHDQRVVEWMGAEGARVPEDVGFVNLNWTLRTADCAGIDHQPRELGAIAIERVVDMVHRRELGVPPHPQSILLPVRWVAGATVRDRHPAAPPAPSAPAHHAESR